MHCEMCNGTGWKHGTAPAIPCEHCHGEGVLI